MEETARGHRGCGEDTGGERSARPPAMDAASHAPCSGAPGASCAARGSHGRALRVAGAALALALAACVAGTTRMRGTGEAAVLQQTGLGGARAARTQQMARALARVFVKNLERRIAAPGAPRAAAAPRASLLSRSATALRNSEYVQPVAHPRPSLPLQTLAGTERGRGGDEAAGGAGGEAGEQGEAGGAEEADGDEGVPGFEPPVGREPLSAHATGVDPGLRGEETSVVAAIDHALHELGEDVGDEEVVVPSTPVKESATLRWLPFGRDELVEQAPTAHVKAHLNPAADETYTTFPDRIAPDSEQAAFGGTDVEVPQPSASARIEPPAGFITDGTGAGGHWDAEFALQDFMDDQYVAQQSVAANPPTHRIHTDFDLQGLLPDVAVPGSEYLANLGEDSRPNGIVDNDLPVLAPVPASPPKPQSAGLIPSTWGDVDVPADGASPSSSPRTTKDLRAAAEAVRAGDAMGAAARMGAYVNDLTHGDEERRGVFGDDEVNAVPADGAAAQIEQHAPLLSMFGRPEAEGGGGGADAGSGESGYNAAAESK